MASWACYVVACVGSCSSSSGTDSLLSNFAPDPISAENVPATEQELLQPQAACSSYAIGHYPQMNALNSVPVGSMRSHREERFTEGKCEKFSKPRVWCWTNMLKNQLRVPWLENQPNDCLQENIIHFQGESVA